MKRACTYVLVGVVLFSLLGGFSLPKALAQSTPQEAAQISEQDISFSTDPEVPGSFQNVTITVASYLTDVNRAFYIWKKDGKTALEATGAYTYTFTTGDLGQKTTISLSMILVTGENINKVFVFEPSEVNLLFEGADSYVPPFYRGRALPSSEGVIRVVAIPQITNDGSSQISNLNNYVFGWKKNDQVFSTDSGYAKNAFLFQQSYLDDTEDIDVTSQDNSTSAIAEGKVSIPVYSPKILMYAKDPINGIDWNHELGDSYDVTAAEKTIIAIPYFFSPANPISNDLQYTWTINGDPVNTPTTKNVLSLQSGDSKGASSLKLTIQNTLKLFLDAEKDITINLK